MSKDKISSQEMVEQIAAKLSVSKRVAEEFLKSLFAEIEEALLKGESVKVKNLGTFKMQWNEPRKSVNVQTGEVFTIEGYNKVTFTPDADLKDAVNEPYSHLDPVELDGQDIPSFEIEKPAASTPDNLRNLTEQASEIKDILSEINALSRAKSPVIKAVEPEKIDIPDYDIILIDEEDENSSKGDENDNSITEAVINPEPEPEVIVEPELSESEIAEPVQYNTTESTYSPEIKETTAEVKAEIATTEPFITSPKKKSRKGLRILTGFIIVALIIGGTIYAVYFSSSCIRCWVQYDLLSEANRQKMSEYANTFKGWFSSSSDTKQKIDSTKNDTNIVLPDSAAAQTAGTQDPTQTQQTDTKPATPTDSLQQLFDSHREYTEFLGEEEITEGTRLTTIAQHYYGKKDFWVYIYEANRDNIVHPDRITPGTIVKIPKVDPRLIDKKNPRCIQKARELHDLYVGKK